MIWGGKGDAVVVGVLWRGDKKDGKYDDKVIGEGRKVVVKGLNMERK